MHSFTASTVLPTSADYTHFSFNSDLSGDVIIHRGDDEFSVPGKHLIEFIAQYVRMERISAIEQMDDRDLLGLEKR